MNNSDDFGTKLNTVFGLSKDFLHVCMYVCISELMDKKIYDVIWKLFWGNLKRIGV